MGRSISRKVSVPLDAKDAFLLLTEAKSVATWYGANRANIDPRAGGSYEVFWQPNVTYDSTEGCRITAFTANKSMTVEWRGPTVAKPFGFMSKPGSTKVKFTVSGQGSKSTIAISHTGFKTGPEWDQAFEYYTRRWGYWSHNLDVLADAAVKIADNEVNVSAITERRLSNSPGRVFLPAAGSGTRMAFDFREITLNHSNLFGAGIQFANVADQA